MMAGESPTPCPYGSYFSNKIQIQATFLKQKGANLVYHLTVTMALNFENVI
jgi:hypothetical protein